MILRGDYLVTTWGNLGGIMGESVVDNYIVWDNICDKVWDILSTGEISSDLYRNQFSRRILNLSSVMFILMFFIDFWGLFCDPS